jgi:hypothetical protein
VTDWIILAGSLLGLMGAAVWTGMLIRRDLEELRRELDAAIAMESKGE